MVNNTSKCYSVLRDPAVTAWGKTKTNKKKLQQIRLPMLHKGNLIVLFVCFQYTGS